MLLLLDPAAHPSMHWYARAFGWVFQLLHSKWTIITGAVSLGASLAKILPVAATKYQAWRDYRLLRRRVGADLYTRQDLVRATEYYVEPDCQATDPAGQEDFRRVAPIRTPAHRTLRNLLDPSSEQRFLILLADSGMGKTTLLMNFYALYGRRSRREEKIVLIPLGHPEADERIAAVREKSNTILFLDAFDEDTKAIYDHKERVAALVEISKDFARVLMTCRTQFFASDAEIPQETGLIRIGTVRAGQSRTYTFYKVYLSPFSEAQINDYIRKRFPFWQRERRRRARAIVNEAPDLTMRPMLLSHVPDLIDGNYSVGNAASLYKAMTRAWFLREKPLVEPEPLEHFSIALAKDIYSNRVQRGSEKMSPDEALALAHKLHIPLESWQMRGRSLLNRDADGNLKFSHRSLLEYFFVVAFFDDPAGSPKVPWTDQMKRFWWDMITTRCEESVSDVERIALDRDVHDVMLYGDPSGLVRLGVKSIIAEWGYSALHSSRPKERYELRWLGPFLFEKVRIKRPGTISANEFEPESCVVDPVLGLLWDGHVHEANSDLEAERIERAVSDGWRLPTKYEAASLRPHHDPSLRVENYPRSVFDRWGAIVWVRDEDGALRLMVYPDSNEDSPALVRNLVRNEDGRFSWIRTSEYNKNLPVLSASELNQLMKPAAGTGKYSPSESYADELEAWRSAEAAVPSIPNAYVRMVREMSTGLEFDVVQ